MDNCLDDLQEGMITHTIADVEALQAEHEKFKAEALQDANNNYEDLNTLVQQMADLGSTDNPYTTLTPQVGPSWWALIGIGSACTGPSPLWVVV